MNQQTKWSQFGVLITVFFFWGFVAASNGIFIPFCKTHFQIMKDQFINSKIIGIIYKNLVSKLNLELNNLRSVINIDYLNNIHTLITRFIQLREQSSEYDENHNVIGLTTNKITANHKPLVNYLASFKNKLYWLLLVARNMKKVYDTDGSNDEYSDL